MQVLEKIYLSCKGVSLVASLVLALWYSKLLGPENRSIVSYLMISAMIIWIIFSSGATLTLRILSNNISLEILKSFKSFLILIFIIGIILFNTCIFFYLNYIKYFPLTLICLGMIYFIMCGLTIILLEVSIANNHYSKVGMIEIISISVQFLIFSLLVRFEIYSNATNLFIAIIISYLISTLYLIKLNKSFILKTKGFNNPKYFFNKCKSNATIGVSFAILDRFDKILIAYIFPLGLLAIYSMTNTLTSQIRLIPDYYSKILFSYPIRIFPKSRVNLFLIVCITPVCVFFFTYLVSALVVTILGNEWVLPMTVIFLMVCQEILRGFFFLIANRNLKLKIHSTNKLLFFITLISIILCPLFAVNFGLIGVPLSMCTVYSLGILFYLKVINDKRKSL